MSNSQTFDKHTNKLDCSKWTSHHMTSGFAFDTHIAMRNLLVLSQNKSTIYNVHVHFVSSISFYYICPFYTEYEAIHVCNIHDQR